MQNPLPEIDISLEQWEIVRGILQTYVPDYEVWAFGSRATRTAKLYSDLDLAVITKDPLGHAVHASLVEAFSESDLPWKVDIVDWARTSGDFRKVIQTHYVVVQRSTRALSN